MALTDIDPALGLMADFTEVAKGTPKHIDAMRRDAILTDGAVPARLKALAAMLWAISARCEPCAAFYIGEAVRCGATETELGEFLAIASTMGGCVGEMWALKAFKAYKDRTNPAGTPQAASPTADDACCASSA